MLRQTLSRVAINVNFAAEFIKDTEIFDRVAQVVTRVTESENRARVDFVLYTGVGQI